MSCIRSRLASLMAVLFLAATGAAQTTGDGQTGPPQRQLPPRWADRIDPADDPLLKSIQALVKPTEEQMARITELCVQLRADQMRAAHVALRLLRDETRRGDGATPPTAEERSRLRAAVQAKIAELVKPVNEKFLSDCRALLDEGRFKAWDAGAAELDLMQRGSGASQREEMRWLNPQRGPKIGDVAPEFELKNLEGNKVSLRSMRGKPVVIEFGSYTSPSFRERAESLNALCRDYGDAVHWIVVYTFEAHASDSTWISARNTAKGIEIPQHVSMKDRLKCATLTKERLKLSPPVLLDDLKNTVAEAYSGHPNRGYVIDASGRVFSKQVWIDPKVTKKALDQLLDKTGGKGKEQTPPAGSG